MQHLQSRVCVFFLPLLKTAKKPDLLNCAEHPPLWLRFVTFDATFESNLKKQSVKSWLLFLSGFVL